MEPKKNPRNSSLELLRILMMLQIILLHAAEYGGYSAMAQELGGIHAALYWFLYNMSHYSVFVYVMISGYFLSASAEGGSFRRILRAYLPMLFYALVIPVAVSFIGYPTVKATDVIRAFLPFLSRTWYFMTLYIILLFLVPYLNKLVHAMDRREFLWLLGGLFFLFSVWQPLSMVSPYDDVISVYQILHTDGGKSIYGFAAMYLLGAFLRRYHFLPEGGKWRRYYRNWMNLAAVFILAGIHTAACYLSPDFRSIAHYNDAPLNVLQCIFLFRFFAGMQFTSRFINAVSACNLGVYIIHEHNLIRQFIWHRIFPLTDLRIYETPLYILRLLGIPLAIFAVCAGIEWLRQQASRGIGTVCARLRTGRGDP